MTDLSERLAAIEARVAELESRNRPYVPSPEEVEAAREAANRERWEKSKVEVGFVPPSQSPRVREPAIQKAELGADGYYHGNTATMAAHNRGECGCDSCRDRLAYA